MDEKNSKLGSEDTVVVPEWLMQQMFDSRQASAQARVSWKTTVLQVQAVFLSLCLPLSLAAKPQGVPLQMLKIAALSCILSLVTGTVALILESSRAHRTEILIRQRILERERSVAIGETTSRCEVCTTAVFVLASLVSLLCLYLSVLFRS